MLRRLSCTLVPVTLGLFVAGQAWAQGVTVGVKGGLNLSDLKAETNGVKDEVETATGFAGGGFLQLGIGDVVAIRPEALFSQKGASDTEDGTAIDFMVDYVEVPVLLALRVPVSNSAVRPVLFAGPAVSFETRCEVKMEEGGTALTVDCDDPLLDGGAERKQTDVGAVFGGGLELSAGNAVLSAEGRYNLGLVDVDDTAEGVAKHRVWSFLAGVGYRIR